MPGGIAPFLPHPTAVAVRVGDPGAILLNQLLDMMEETTRDANEALDQALAAIHETSADLAQADDRCDQLIAALRAEMGESQFLEGSSGN